jgi:hypothetical protein
MKVNKIFVCTALDSAFLFLFIDHMQLEFVTNLSTFLIWLKSFLFPYF